MAYQLELKGTGRLCQSNSLILIFPLLSHLTVTIGKQWGKKNGTE